MRSIYFLLLIVGASAAMAGEKQVPRMKTAIPAQIAAFDQHPFDPAAEALPRNYRGHNCSAVAAKVRNLKGEKGAYETSAEYAARIESVKARLLIGNLMADSHLAFVADTSTVTLDNYDADAGTMKRKVYLAGTSIMMVDTTSVGSALVERKAAGRRQYVGENAFGRKVVVTSSLYVACALAFKNIDANRAPMSMIQDIKFDLPPSEARSAVPNMRLLFVGKFAPPFYQEFSGYFGPTISTPYEATGSGDTLVMDLFEIWVFDKATGRVLAKSRI